MAPPKLFRGIPPRSLGGSPSELPFAANYNAGTISVMNGNALGRPYRVQAVEYINMNTKTYDQATAKSVESLLRKQPLTTIDGSEVSLYGYLFDEGKDANVNDQIGAIDRSQDLTPRERLQLVSILPAFKPKSSRTDEYHSAITNARRRYVQQIHTKVTTIPEGFSPRVTLAIKTKFPKVSEGLYANVEGLQFSKNSEFTFQKNTEGNFEYYEDLDDGNEDPTKKTVLVDGITQLVNNPQSNASYGLFLEQHPPGSAERELLDVGEKLKGRKDRGEAITKNELVEEIEKIEDIKAVLRSGGLYSNTRLTDNLGLYSKPPLETDARDVFDIAWHQQELAHNNGELIQAVTNRNDYTEYNPNEDEYKKLHTAATVFAVHNGDPETGSIISLSSDNSSSPHNTEAKIYKEIIEKLEDTPEGRLGAALAEYKRQIKTDAEDEADRVKGKLWCVKHWYVCVPLGVMTGFILVAELAECLGANGGTPEWNKCANPAKERCKRQCFSDWDDPSYWDDGELYGRDAADRDNRTLKALHVGDEEHDSMYQFNTQWGYTMLNENQSETGTDRYHSRNREAWEEVPDKGLYCTTENLRKDPANTTCEGYCEDACADAYPDRGFGSIFGRAARQVVEFGVQSGVEVSKGVFDGIFGDNFFNGLLFVILLLVGFFLYKSFK